MLYLLLQEDEYESESIVDKVPFFQPVDRYQALVFIKYYIPETQTIKYANT